jgi:hypothetical protein
MGYRLSNDCNGRSCQPSAISFQLSAFSHQPESGAAENRELTAETQSKKAQAVIACASGFNASTELVLLKADS